jgi:hypothetical protein
MHGIAGMASDPAAVGAAGAWPVRHAGGLQAARAARISAPSPAPQLFATDCTGGGCHKGPQGLGKNYGQFGLTTFLREHYTNSRQSAAALAEYLLRSPGRDGNAQPAERARRAILSRRGTSGRGGAGLAVAAGDAPRCRT